MLKRLLRWVLTAFLVALIGAAGMVTVDHFEPRPRQAEQAAKDHRKLDAFNILASERVAYYTKILAIFTGFLMAVSALQIWYLIKADRRSADALDEGTNQFVLSQRAFVYLDGFEADARTGKEARKLVRFAFMPRWQNSGETPTKNLRVAIDWTHCNGELPDGFPHAYRQKAVPLFLGPHATEKTETIDIGPGLANQVIDDANGAIGWEKRNAQIYVWGRADYEDVFGGKHFSEFCYRAHFSSQDGNRIEVTFLQWGEHNRTDDDQRA